MQSEEYRAAIVNSIGVQPLQFLLTLTLLVRSILLLLLLLLPLLLLIIIMQQ